LKGFFDAFDAYIARFSSTKDNLKTKNEDLDNELALYSVIQTVLYLLIKSSTTKAQRYLNKPVLKKGNKITYI